MAGTPEERYRENLQHLQNPKVQAMLKVIRHAEGTDNPKGYNTRVGYTYFDDLSKKPGQKVYIKSIGDYSSAEGAYQFLNSTYEGLSKKLNLRDFSKKSQDIAAVELLRENGALYNILEDDFEGAVVKASPTWASLPNSKGGSNYKDQKVRNIESLKNIYFGNQNSQGEYLSEDPYKTEVPQAPNTQKVSYLADSSLFSNFEEEKTKNAQEELIQAQQQKNNENEFIQSLIKQAQVQFVDPEKNNSFQGEEENMFQVGGQRNKAMQILDKVNQKNQTENYKLKDERRENTTQIDNTRAFIKPKFTDPKKTFVEGTGKASFLEKPVEYSKRIVESSLNNFNKTLGIDVYPTPMSTDKTITEKDTVININNNKVDFNRFNQYKKANTLIGGEFIEGNSNNIKTAKEWKNSQNELIGDSDIVTKDVKSFYGVEDGKLKLGSIKDFNPNTIVVANRYDKGQKINKTAIVDGRLRLLDDSNNPIYTNVTEGGKLILYSEDNKNPVFISFNDPKKGQQQVEEYIKKNTNTKPIVIDNGRYRHYATSNNLLSSENIDNYHSSDILRDREVGYNLSLTPKMEDGGEYSEQESAFLEEIKGIPISSGGMYQYPNQKVVIPSSRITMKNIPHSILAITDQGDKKILEPEKEYQLKGNSTLEIPLTEAEKAFLQEFQDGGLKNVYTPQGQVDPNTGMVSTSSSTPSSQTLNLEDVAFSVNLPEIVLQGKPKTKEKLTLKQEREILKQQPSTEMRGITNILEEETKTKDKTYNKEAIIASENYEKQLIEDKKQKELKLYNNRRNDLNSTETIGVFDINKLNNTESIKKVQEELVSAGYDLNPTGKFENNGVDGKMGKITKAAIDDYNKYGVKGRYTSYKTGEGLLGKCTEKQCNEFTQNEIFRNLKPQVEREEWNNLTGLTGDAWRMGENIEKAGGQKIETKKVKPGDVVMVHVGGSSYAEEAKKYGKDYTHTGIVDKVNPDGTYYITHNVHEETDEGTQGREYRNKIDPKNNKVTGWNTLYVKEAYRPNYGAVKNYEKSNSIRKDTSIVLNKDKEGISEYMNKNTDSKLKTNDAFENINTFLKPINDVENKKKVSVKYNLDEDEYQSLSKVALGILGQEGSFGTSLKLPVKQAGATISKALNYFPPAVGLNEVYKAVTGENILKQDEVSKGAGQFKYKTNLGNADLGYLGVNEDNFAKDENMPLVMLNKLAEEYKLQRKKYGVEKALYKTVEKYNRGKNTKFSDSYDSDYVNKVLNFTTIFDITDKEKSKYNTTLDKIMLNDNVLKFKKL